jgi:hypothetical protein
VSGVPIGQTNTTSKGDGVIASSMCGGDLEELATERFLLLGNWLLGGGWGEGYGAYIYSLHSIKQGVYFLADILESASYRPEGLNGRFL